MNPKDICVGGGGDDSGGGNTDVIDKKENKDKHKHATIFLCLLIAMRMIECSHLMLSALMIAARCGRLFSNN